MYDPVTELEHYGVLGMKWGVRKERSSNPRKANILHKKSEQKWIKKNVNSNDHGFVKGQSYDHDIEMPKGSIGYRAQTVPGMKSGPLYLTYDKEDHLKYLNAAISYPELGIAKGAVKPSGEVSLYTMKFEAKEPIKAPSFSHAMETFVEMVGDVGIKDINPYDSKCKSGKDFIDSWKKRKTTSDGPEFSYRRFVDTMRRNDRGAFYEEFKKRLAEKGYNALVDPMDRPSKRATLYEAPFVILDPQKTLKIKAQSKISKDDVDYLRKYEYDFGDIDAVDKQVKNSPNLYTAKQRKTHKTWKKWLSD